MNSFFRLDASDCCNPLLERSRSEVRPPLFPAQLDRPIVRDAAGQAGLLAAHEPGGNPEYARHQGIYDCVGALDASQGYRETLLEGVRRMPPELKALYNQYAGQLVCLDTGHLGTPYFSPLEGGFRLNEHADLESPFGAGSAFFHESAHMLDYLMGRRYGADSVSSLYGLANAALADLNDALSSIMNAEGCTYAEAQGKLSAELASHMKVSACVSDVFGGLTGNKVAGVFGHSAEYWATRGWSAISREAFAEITADSACSPEALAYTQKMMPRTYAAYQMILERGGSV